MLTTAQRSEISRQTYIRTHNNGIDPDEIKVNIEAELQKIDRTFKMKDFYLIRRAATMNLCDCAIKLQQRIPGAIARPAIDLVAKENGTKLHQFTAINQFREVQAVLKHCEAKDLLLVPRVILTDIESGRSASVYDTRENRITKKQQKILLDDPSLLECPPNEITINPYVLKNGIWDAKIVTRMGGNPFYETDPALAKAAHDKLLELLDEGYMRMTKKFFLAKGYREPKAWHKSIF